MLIAENILFHKTNRLVVSYYLRLYVVRIVEEGYLLIEYSSPLG
jgi:hypothetical protein